MECHGSPHLSDTLTKVIEIVERAGLLLVETGCLLARYAAVNAQL
jgi:hypothetical protein